MASRHICAARIPIALSVLTAVACGGGSDSAAPPPPPAPTIVAVTVAPGTLQLNVGASGELNATVTTSAGISANPTVSWSSANATVATISGSGTIGTVIGVSPGTALITATSGERSGTATVTVAPAPQPMTVTVVGGGTVTSAPAGITCPSTCTASFPAGTSVTLGAVPATGSRFLEWSEACTGTTTCSVSMTAARRVTATFEAIPAPVFAIDVTAALSTVNEDQTVQLTATPRDAAGNALTGRALTWTSSDTTLATVTSTGLVLGRQEGDTVTITVASEGKAGSARVVVRSLFFIARDFSVGERHICATRLIGGVYCWGLGNEGQLGNTTSNPAAGPVALVDGGLRFVRSGAGSRHSCALDTNSAAWCWGHNFFGQVGDGSTDNGRPLPVRVAGATTFDRLYAGYTGTCGLTTSGVAWCWGDNSNSALGVPSTGSTVRSPTAVVGGHTYRELSLGASHACGIETAGTLRCWGLGNQGQLGVGDFAGRPGPVPVAPNLTWRSVGAGGNHTCAVDSTGEAWCWGLNNFGQLGDGTLNQTSAPVRVSTAQRFQRVANGAAHACAVTTVGDVWCWGLGDTGQLGHGTLGTGVAESRPVRVQSTVQFVDINAKGRNTCGLTTRRRLYCWGDNSQGQLAAPPNTGSPTPVAVMRP